MILSHRKMFTFYLTLHINLTSSMTLLNFLTSFNNLTITFTSIFNVENKLFASTPLKEVVILFILESKRNSHKICCSVAVESDFETHEMQHDSLLCLSLSPRIVLNSSPWCQWCHPIASSCVAPFSSCPQSFPAPRSFPMSQLLTSGGQSSEASA